MRRFLIQIVTLLAVVVESQSITAATVPDTTEVCVSARIIDAATGEALPFASIYINKEKNTISNAVGEFTLMASPADEVRISYVGFHTKTFHADRLPKVVKLTSDGQQLNEVVVYSADHIISQVYKRCLKSWKKHRKDMANIFYRQITYTDSQCTTYLESFLASRTAFSLRSMQLLTGRFVAVASSLTTNPTNFYTFAQIEPFSTKKSFTFNDLIPPLSPNYLNYFVVEMETIHNNGRRMYVIYFYPRNDYYWTVNSRLYVDAETFDILKFEGETWNNKVVHSNKKKHDICPVEHTFMVTYQLDNGFSEIQSVSYGTRYHHNDHTYETTGVMFNVGDRYVQRQDTKLQLPATGTHGTLSDAMKRAFSGLSFDGNLLQEIQQKGIDKTFWKENEIVKRTPIEQKAVEIFEHDNLFGLF